MNHCKADANSGYIKSNSFQATQKGNLIGVFVWYIGSA